MTYNVFTRNWWKRNPAWPGGREPHPGRKKYIRRGVSLAEARGVCELYNSVHKPGFLSRKAEFEEASHV